MDSLRRICLAGRQHLFEHAFRAFLFIALSVDGVAFSTGGTGVRGEAAQQLHVTGRSQFFVKSNAALSLR
jgi:hypothetical protein